MNEAQTSRMEDLKGRAKRCCCKYCGDELTLRRIVYGDVEDARVELFCKHCNRIKYGVEREIYLAAKYFVDEIGYDHYPSIDPSVRKKRMNIAVICDILAWGFKNTGLLDKDGFKTALDLEAGVLGEAMFISDTALNGMKGE